MQFITPKSKIIDIGQVVGGFFPEGRYFGNGVGIGFDAVVGFEALKLKIPDRLPILYCCGLENDIPVFQSTPSPTRSG